MEKKGRTYIEIVGVMLVLQLLLNALLFSVWHIGYILGGVDGALRGTVICKNCKVGVFPNEMGRLTRSLCFQKRVGEQKRSRFQKGTGPLDGDSWATGANKGCSLGYFPKNENPRTFVQLFVSYYPGWMMR